MSTLGHGHLSFPKTDVTVSRTAALLFPPRRHRLLVLLFPKRSPTSLRHPSSRSVSNTLEAAKTPYDRPAGTPSQSNSFLFDVSGMMCGGCEARVKSILSSDDRVLPAAVNLLTETVAVRLREGELSEVADALAAKLSECGLPERKRSAAAEDRVGVADGVRRWREVADACEGKNDEIGLPM